MTPERLDDIERSMSSMMMHESRRKMVNELIQAVREGMAEVLRLREDAERYRKLKANHLQTGPDTWIRTGDDLEEAVDAMKGKP